MIESTIPRQHQRANLLVIRHHGQKVPKNHRLSAWLLRSGVAAHLSFLIHALWQTFRGRTRMDVDVIGGAALAIAGLLLLLPLIAIVCRVALMARELWFGVVPVQRPH